MSSLVTILPICSYIGGEVMYGRFFGAHNTCILYAIEMAKFEIEIHIEMATRLHAAYLGTVCNYAFHSMQHTGLLLRYQQSLVN